MSPLITLLIENTLIALLFAAIALLAGRLRRPALAHVAWLLVLLKLVTPPLWSIKVKSPPPTTVSAAAQPVQPLAARSTIAALSSTSIADTSIDLAERMASPTLRVAPIAAKAIRVQPIIVAVSLLGTLVVLTVFITRTVRFRRSLNHAAPADDALRSEVVSIAKRIGLRRAPSMLVVSNPISPMIWFVGLAAPRLILPAALLDTFTPEQRSGILAHELAHLKRRDQWVRLLELPIAAALWFHPLVWLARTGLRETEEQCCDAWALSLQAGERRTYADALVAAMEWVSDSMPLPSGATGLGRLNTLKRRLAMIVTQSPSKSLSTLGRCAAATMIAAALLAPSRTIAQSAPPATTTAIPNDAIHLAAGASIQKAIDAASDGATIVLDAGSFDESITITKPLTLIGAGWQKTIVGHTQPTGRTQQEKDDFFKRLDAAKTNGERQRIAADIASFTEGPTITVKDTANVTIRDLRIRGPIVKSAGDMLPSGSLVSINRATAITFNNVALIGPSSNGFDVRHDSDVAIDHSLVAGFWNKGIEIVGAKAWISDSDIRNCYSRCITVVAGDGSVIERNRISGSAWHGIRYDGCSPTIRGNAIFGNARSGIYASGKTAATVTGNLFASNEMDGMSCWFANEDEVSANLFINNLREHIAVLGNSKTKLSHNLFVGSPVGVACNAIGGETPSVLGSPAIDSNSFAGNTADVQRGQDATPLPDGNTVLGQAAFPVDETVEQRLARAAQLDAWKTKPMPPSPSASPFPITDEEKSMIPDTATRDYAAWKK